MRAPFPLPKPLRAKGNVSMKSIIPKPERRAQIKSSRILVGQNLQKYSCLKYKRFLEYVMKC